MPCDLGLVVLTEQAGAGADERERPDEAAGLTSAARRARELATMLDVLAHEHKHESGEGPSPARPASALGGPSPSSGATRASAARAARAPAAHKLRMGEHPPTAWAAKAAAADPPTTTTAPGTHRTLNPQAVEFVRGAALAGSSLERRETTRPRALNPAAAEFVMPAPAATPGT